MTNKNYLIVSKLNRLPSVEVYPLKGASDCLILLLKCLGS